MNKKQTAVLEKIKVDATPEIFFTTAETGFGFILPLLINNSYQNTENKKRDVIGSNLIVTNEYNVKEYHDGVYEYADIKYENSNLIKRIFLNLRSFPNYRNDDKDEFKYFSYKLLDNISRFLPADIPTLHDTDSFLRDTGLKEIIDNAIQSSYAIQRQSDIESGYEYSDDYYDSISRVGGLRGIFEVLYDFDILPDQTKAHYIVTRSYGQYSQFHHERILQRLDNKENLSKIEMYLKLEKENCDHPSCTGNGGYGLYNVKTGLKNDLNIDFYYRFIPFVNLKQFNIDGIYQFAFIIPERKSRVTH